MTQGIDNKIKNEFRILVVDDDPHILVQIAYLLKSKGYQIDQAENGVMALNKINTGANYDLVVLDIMMPTVSGLDVCKTIREKYNLFELPILFLSALSNSEDIASGLKAGANDYVTKPINRIELLARVKNLLSLKQLNDLARANEQLASYRALYDDLTGLPNRSFMYNKLQEYIIEAKRNDTAIALLFLNMDRFRSINNSLGHSVGDIYLREFSQRILDFISGNGCVVRLHSDSFAVVNTDIEKTGNEKEKIREFAEKLLEIANEPVIVNHYELILTASIGIALYPHDARTIDEMIRYADSAMYYAKEKRNTPIVFHTKVVHARETRRFKLARRLKKALENDEFTLHYQPQIDAESERIVGVEALVRWNHPDEGIISPVKFIPVAEETGMIIPMSEWILSTACAQNKLWQEMGFQGMKVSVNLSPQHFHNNNLIRHVDEAMYTTKLDPQYLELEITESTIMSNLEEAVDILKQLRKMGIGLSVDDFGTGYSSFNYLKQFPINTLKIDQSFISRDIRMNRQEAAIVTSMIKLGHSLDLNVIAEGVETQEQLEYLRDNYCNQIQGYYYSKPLSADKLTDLLKARS